jgi:uracil-DNA glycosylase
VTRIEHRHDATPFLPERMSLKSLREAAAGCRGCHLYADATQTVFGEGLKRARLMMVGEIPGDREDRAGRVFVGPAGRELDKALERVGIVREDVYITNVVKARPPRNRDPKAGEVAHHMPWLEAELALVRPGLVVPLGRHALAHFTGGAKISDVHGTEMIERGRSLFPLYHPAAALRGGALRETLFADARKLRQAVAARRAR